MSSQTQPEGRTAAQEIVLAAFDLDEAGNSEFSEWDLTVAVWKRDSNRFGCRGYETLYPDHKRVMKEIMNAGSTNPIRRGWLERTRPNRYRITDLGKSEGHRLRRRSTGESHSHAAPQSVYDAVAPYYQNPAFRKHLQDPNEPRLWMGAASFLQLQNTDPQHLKDRMTSARSAIDDALDWLEQKGEIKIVRGVTGGSEAISKERLIRLQGFLELLETRFANQIEAIRSSGR